MHVNGQNTMETLCIWVSSLTLGLAAEWNASSTLLSYPDNLSIVYWHIILVMSLYPLCLKYCNHITWNAHALLCHKTGNSFTATLTLHLRTICKSISLSTMGPYGRLYDNVIYVALINYNLLYIVQFQRLWNIIMYLVCKDRTDTQWYALCVPSYMSYRQ